MVIEGSHLLPAVWAAAIYRISQVAPCSLLPSCGAREAPLAQGLDPVWAWISAGWVQFWRRFGGAGWAVLELDLSAPDGELDWDSLLVSCLEGCASAQSVGPIGVWIDCPVVGDI
ncbi:hypothetical protein NDU88_007077 [Pleurodeles waltl]|uniref:Uncharacterized protein n=1 Tax=Pleurodeles waltl TaxID=8319 RepID=A0AAV7PN90_PLEWA|nr:hypothetical protein NDU88_007077 [Pleurodeles waltl]